MPVWWVSEPFISLRIEDEPLGYQPARGGRMSFHLGYRQRGFIEEQPDVFGVGTNWTCSFRSFIVVPNSSADPVVFHAVGTGVQVRRPNERFSWDNSWLIPTNSGYQVQYPDGSYQEYTTAFTAASGAGFLFLTLKSDPAGNQETYTYATNSGVFRLVSVTDADGKQTKLYYDNGSWSNLITRVEDPFSRTNYLMYDAAGYLTNIVDVIGLTNTFAYDSGDKRGWITNLTTPYGVTSFAYGGVDALNDEISYWSRAYGAGRSVTVTLPNGGKHLYVYQSDCSTFLGSWTPTPPDTSLYGDNMFEPVGYFAGDNSFHWGPLQYLHLSTSDPDALSDGDFALGRMRHWLYDRFHGHSSLGMALERQPSPDGTTEGQTTWFDYAGKLYNEQTGTNNFPSFVARVLPDGSTQFMHYERDDYGQVTEEVSTYTKLDGTVGLRTNTYVYAANRLDLVQVVSPNQEQVVSNYFASGNLIHLPDASYDALAQETKYQYNGYGQLVIKQSPTGLTTSNYYVPSGDGIYRLALTADWEIKRTNSYQYYANGLVYSHLDERGLSTTNNWDNLQRLTGRKYPDGTTISNIYSALDVTATKDRLGNWSYTGYNSIRQPLAETNANGVVTRYGYCDCGALMSVTNAWHTPAEFVTSYNYDLQGNRTNVFLPDAVITTWFDSLQRVVATCDAWGCDLYYYNNQGLLISVTNAYGAKQRTVFDIEDRPVYVTDANNVTVTNTYDLLGRLRTRTYPDAGVEEFGFSARGLTAYTNQLGATNFYAYDEARRKVAETNANAEVIRYTNNAAGDLLALVDGKNQVTKWGYDEYGRVTNKLDQVGTEILRYKYDPDSRLTNRWSVTGGNVYYTYDAIGNLTSGPYVGLAYDALNRVTNMVDEVGTTAYAYTLGGQLYTEDGPWSDDTVTNSYTSRLRTALSLAQPTGHWTNGFGYDAARRLTNVTSAAGAFGYVLPSTYPTRLPQKLTLPNTSYITNTYDDNARLLTTTLNNSSDTTLNSHTYTYNSGSQRTQQSFNAGSTANYTYDPIGQLKFADSATPSEDRGYAYDTAWNLHYRTNNGTLQTFVVNGKNELTNAVGDPGVYDGNGNLRTNGFGKAQYFYNADNLLAAYYHCQSGYIGSPTNGDVWIEYFYDGMQRLRWRREHVGVCDGGTPETRPSGEGLQLDSPPPPDCDGGWDLVSETRYIYDGWRVIQERDTNNTPTVSYTRGTDLSGSLEGAGGIGGLLARSDGYSSGNFTSHNYYHADGNGNITYLVNSSQTLAASYRYDPYGNLLAYSGSLAAANTYRFSSKMADDLTGLYYYGYRWYAPNLQRWLNRDPIEEGGGINLYGFVGNGSIDIYDALGLHANHESTGFAFPQFIVVDGKVIAAYKPWDNGLGPGGSGNCPAIHFPAVPTNSLPQLPTTPNPTNPVVPSPPSPKKPAAPTLPTNPNPTNPAPVIPKP